jgi:AraC-like DNA-binding protein
MNLVFSTSEFPLDERLPALHEAVSERFLPLRVAPIERELPFEGAVMAREFDGLRVSRFTGSSLAAVRNTGHIDASTSDDYLVALHVKGLARARQDGRQVILRPGDLALLDSTRPYSMELLNAGPFEHLAYQVPRPALDCRANDVRRAVAVAVAAGSDAGGLASHHLCALAAPTWRTPVAQSAPLVEIGLDLLSAALCAAAGLSVADTSHQTKMLASVKRHALARLGDPDLSPASVAGALYISPRQLHRLFARQEMTFGCWLREQRLRRSRRDLADERLRSLSIAQIAGRWGYRSNAHFTRSFSARFGVGPRDFRRTAHESHESRMPAAISRIAS